MDGLTQTSAADRRRIAKSWLAGFDAALARGDWRGVTQMMGADGYWRDLLTFGWDFRSLHGAADIEAWLAAYYATSGGRDFAVQSEPTLGVVGAFGETLEFFVSFQTEVATGRGYVRLVADGLGDYRAFTIVTAMQELKAFPEVMRRDRPRGKASIPERGLENWLDQREATQAFRERDPEVVIVGAGMAGLMLAARLGQLGVPTLIVDRGERVGDVWRKRYHSLTLHNEICTNHFPYLPFPDHWPVYIPKDKLANWMEFYADAMELNVWNRTEFLGGAFDEADKRWTVRVRLSDGSERTMRPGHMVMAMGVSGLPNWPDFPGMSDFAGPIVHSSGHTDDIEVAGKTALVVGAGTSGHDIAQDLYLRGAEVTMLQRSSTCVVSLEPSSIRVFELFKRNEGLRPTDDIDLMAAGIPFDIVRRLQGPMSRLMAEDDKELLDGLRAVGFLLDNGEDDTGYFLKLLRYQAGYYLNVGASDLLVQRKVKLKSGVEIARVTSDGVVFSDGDSLKIDILVLATGYLPLQEGIRGLFGDHVADRVGADLGVGGEWRVERDVRADAATGDVCGRRRIYGLSVLLALYGTVNQGLDRGPFAGGRTGCGGFRDALKRIKVFWFFFSKKNCFLQLVVQCRRRH